MSVFSKRNQRPLERLEEPTIFDGGLSKGVIDSSSFDDEGVFENPDIPAELSVPAYSSKPDAPAILYLDFNGHNEDVQRKGQSGEPFSKVESPELELLQGTLQEGFRNSNSIVLRVINEIWQAFAEDFAPFNVNVTTVKPGNLSDGKALWVAVGELFHERYKSMLQYR